MDKIVIKMNVELIFDKETYMEYIAWWLIRCCLATLAVVAQLALLIAFMKWVIEEWRPAEELSKWYYILLAYIASGSGAVIVAVLIIFGPWIVCHYLDFHVRCSYTNFLLTYFHPPSF